MIVPVVPESYHRAHLDPVLARVPHAERLTSEDDVALVASYGALVKARKLRFRRIVLAQHGAGQSYGGDPRTARHPCYAGGEGNDDVGLFLVPNEHSAARWRRAYAQTPVAIVGSPRLESLPARAPGPGPVIAVSFHWDNAKIPEQRSAFDHYRTAVLDLARRYSVIGHAHPKRRDLVGFYHRAGIPFVETFDDVCRQADLYVCDNSSTIYEFASTGRPVVVLNMPAYRRDVQHGLRFWDASRVGVNVSDPRDLVDLVTDALMDDITAQRDRESALDIVYAFRSGAAQRAADAIMGWAGIEEVAA